MRNDGFLYTGSNGISRGTVKEQRQQELRKKKLERENKRNELLPKADLVFNEITKLREEVANEITGLIHVDMSKTDVKSVVIGLRLADSKLTSLETRLKNVLRAKNADV